MNYLQLDRLIYLLFVLLKIPLFKAASGIVYYPGKRVLQDFGVYKQGGDMNSSQQMLMNRTDEDYFNTMGIPLIAGRALQSSDTSDQVVVNETALKSLGIGLNEAPGIKLFSDRDGNREEYQIIGVIKDFNFTSLREEIKPLMFSYAAPERLINLVLSTKTSNYSEAVAEAGNVWQQLNIAEPFEYSFLDENLQKQYESDQTLLGIINGFAALAIFISCMGLFGLSAYAAEQRFKEIGIRKVLGASVFGLIKLLSKDFIALILIACLIAVPLSWMIMGKWLEDFAYRMPAGKLVYLLAVFVTLGIGIIAISVQTLKAALSNPVNSIRSE